MVPISRASGSSILGGDQVGGGMIYRLKRTALSRGWRHSKSGILVAEDTIIIMYYI